LTRLKSIKTSNFAVKPIETLTDVRLELVRVYWSIRQEELDVPQANVAIKCLQCVATLMIDERDNKFMERFNLVSRGIDSPVRGQSFNSSLATYAALRPDLVNH